MEVCVVDNTDITNEQGDEVEAVGAELCATLFGGTWVQTSYNSNFRYNYAVLGGTYDSENDAFIDIQPFSSWVLNNTTYAWEAPIAYPTDGASYIWSEDTQQWVLRG